MILLGMVQKSVHRYLSALTEEILNLQFYLNLTYDLQNTM